VKLINDGAEIVLSVASYLMRLARPDSAMLDRAIGTSLVATIVVKVIDEDLPIIYANQAFDRLTGYRTD
jgi:PAS domain-containing protein